MRKVGRSEIVDYQTYEDQRPAFRERAMAEKALRRIHVGPHLTFLFENALTVRYQVQEMMRAERMVREADIANELATYNELLGEAGEFGATLLIEIAEEAERDRLLRAWVDMPRHLYAVLENGERVRFMHDKRQVGDDRLSSVQYLKLPTRGSVPVALGCDLPAYPHEARLSEATRTALAADMADA
jgi:hypothetical protein